MVRLKFDALPQRIQSCYLAANVRAVGADRPVTAERPPTEFYVYHIGGYCDTWVWPASELSGGWVKDRSKAWLPDESMQKRIVDAFFRTWDVIGSDIQDSLRAQGDKWARKVLSRGTLTPKEAYSIIIDHFDRYHGDDEAFDAFEHWHAADYEGSTKAVGPRLKGVGF